MIVNEFSCTKFHELYYVKKVLELYYCTIILRDAMKLQIPRDNNFSSQGAKPRGMKN